MAYLKLVNRAEFSRMAGVSSAAVTKACKHSLKPALVGKRIDLEHPAAVKYLESKEEGEILATGFDPRYEEAVKICRQLGRYSQRTVKKELKVGSERAKKIVGLMAAAGVVPEPDEVPPAIQPPKPKQRPEPEAPLAAPPKKQRVLKGPTVSGKAAGKVTKKDAALANLQTSDPYRHEIPENLQAFADLTLRELIERFGTDVAFLDWLKAIKEIETIETKRLKNATTAGELISRELVRLGVIEPFNMAHVQLLTDGAKTLARKITAMAKAGDDIIEIEKSVVDQVSSFIRPVKAKVSRALKEA